MRKFLLLVGLAVLLAGVILRTQAVISENVETLLLLLGGAVMFGAMWNRRPHLRWAPVAVPLHVLQESRLVRVGTASILLGIACVVAHEFVHTEIVRELAIWGAIATLPTGFIIIIVGVIAGAFSHTHELLKRPPKKD